MALGASRTRRLGDRRPLSRLGAALLFRLESCLEAGHLSAQIVEFGIPPAQSLPKGLELPALRSQRLLHVRRRQLVSAVDAGLQPAHLTLQQVELLVFSLHGLPKEVLRRPQVPLQLLETTLLINERGAVRGRLVHGLRLCSRLVASGAVSGPKPRGDAKQHTPTSLPVRALSALPVRALSLLDKSFWSAF